MPSLLRLAVAGDADARRQMSPTPSKNSFHTGSHWIAPPHVVPDRDESHSSTWDLLSRIPCEKQKYLLKLNSYFPLVVCLVCVLWVLVWRKWCKLIRVRLLESHDCNSRFLCAIKIAFHILHICYICQWYPYNTIYQPSTRRFIYTINAWFFFLHSFIFCSPYVYLFLVFVDFHNFYFSRTKNKISF